MKRITTGFSICLVLVFLSPAAPALAGVVYEIEVTDHAKTETHEMSAQGKRLLMGLPTDAQGVGSEVVYNGDERHLMILDHEKKSYLVFDQAMIDQISGITQQMKQMLESVPESQRGAIEEMMKQKMPQQGAQSSLAKLTAEKTSDKAEKAGYPCVKYILKRDGVKTSEVWVTDWSNVEGGKEIMGVFEDMADFVHEMMESISSGLGSMAGQLDQGFLGVLSEIDGFPVVTLQFADDGSVETESTLRSATERKLDPASFEPPSGYKRQQLMR